MKRLLSILALWVMVAASAAAKGNADIEFKCSTHDFGTIKEADGSVSCVFTYTNTGTAPLVLTSVSAPCNCTKPEFSPKPLAPGKSDRIKVTLSPKNMSGEFMRTISVWTNAKTPQGKKKKITLKIEGAVIPNR